MAKQIKDYNWGRSSTGRLESGSPENIENMKDMLNSTGPGFCLAKWSQVTMHLGNGLTHSCHHPIAHSIPLDELKDNPSALHNTKFKKEQRKQMLDGKRPAECDFCWRVEDNNEPSDRVFKSLDNFSFEHHDKIAQLDGDEDIYPTYVEVSFSRTCNLKCAYCGPAFSSQWHQEIKAEGPYKLEHMEFNQIQDNEEHLLNSDDNPYVEAFWKWWPEAVKHMDTFRITGGEPLLEKDTWKVMDYLLENPNPNITFAINTNGVPPGDMWDKFVDKIKKLQDNNCIKSFELFTSAESTGNKNDYIRYGMDYKVWQRNIEYFLENTEGTMVTIMSAFNILSISTWQELLEWVLVLKQNYNFSSWDTWITKSRFERPTDNAGAKPMDERTNMNYNKTTRVVIDAPYIRHPEFLDANIASQALVAKYLIPSMDFVFNNTSDTEWKGDKGFGTVEAIKMRRNLIAVVEKAKAVDSDGHSVWNSIRKNRTRFYDFITEYDRRRDTNFLETFPEYKEFFELCEKEKVVYFEKKVKK